MLYFISKLLVVRRAACRLYLQISLINAPTYTSHCFVYLHLKELFDCKPQKSSLLNIKETVYWPRYLIYSTSIRKGRGELQDPKTGLWECLYSVSLLRYSLQEVLFSDFSFTVWKDTCSWTALYWHTCTAHDQREKHLLLIIYVWKSPRSLSARSVWVTSPAQEQLFLFVTQGKRVRTFGVIDWPSWPEGQHSVFTILICRGGRWDGRILWSQHNGQMATLYIIIIFHHRYDDNMNLIALLGKLSVINNGMGFWNL